MLQKKWQIPTIASVQKVFHEWMGQKKILPATENRINRLFHEWLGQKNSPHCHWTQDKQLQNQNSSIQRIW